MSDKCYDNFKLAWMADGRLHSSMHATLAEARLAERKVANPRMIMRLHEADGNGHYAWDLMPGMWADGVKYWEFISVAIIIVLAVLLIKRN
jgi:hypothetical protein